MIPKILHYCWFGNNPKSALILKNIESWKKYNPEFIIMEWNDDNCTFNDNTFVKEAYNLKKWAFVSDYIRVIKIKEFGGFYLDTDMEITRSFDGLLGYDCVCGFEVLKKPFSAFFGARSNFPFVNDMVDYYVNLQKINLTPNTVIFSQLLIEKYNVNPNRDEFQILENNFAIFPSTAFSLDIPENYVIHHFDGSWLEGSNTFFKQYVNMYGILNAFIKSDNSKESIHHLINHNKIFKIEEILDQIPFQLIFKYVINKIKNRFIRLK